jgi:hypothetical protein
MFTKKWTFIWVAFLVWIATCGGGIEFRDYKKFITIADDCVKIRYPSINLLKYDRELVDNNSTVSVSYRFRQTYTDGYVHGMPRPFVVIDKSTRMVVSSYLSGEQ